MKLLYEYLSAEMYVTFTLLSIHGQLFATSSAVYINEVSAQSVTSGLRNIK